MNYVLNLFLFFITTVNIHTSPEKRLPQRVFKSKSFEKENLYISFEKECKKGKWLKAERFFERMPNSITSDELSSIFCTIIQSDNIKNVDRKCKTLLFLMFKGANFESFGFNGDGKDFYREIENFLNYFKSTLDNICEKKFANKVETFLEESVRPHCEESQENTPASIRETYNGWK